MQHTDDQDPVSFDRIENTMLLMNKATIALAIFWCSRTCVGMIAQKGECLVKALHVGLANILTELRKTELVNLAQVRYSRMCKSDLSHASPAVWR